VIEGEPMTLPEAWRVAWRLKLLAEIREVKERFISDRERIDRLTSVLEDIVENLHV
jgi:hypothetical protein